VTNPTKGRTWEDIYGNEGAKERRRKQSVALMGHSSSLKGKTYEEIVGPERATTLRASRVESNRRRKGTPVPKQRGPRPALAAQKRAWWAAKTHAQKLAITQPARLAAGSSKPTRIEITMKAALDQLGIEYVFQQPFGRYTVDFYIPSHSLVIECDGEKWHSSPTQRAYDSQRDADLRLLGLSIIRWRGRNLKCVEAARGLAVFSLLNSEEWVA
jgi:very-short-patch-repair endonuclease